jgi:hypothetical protein
MQAATQNATNNNAAQASIFLTYLSFPGLGAANEAKASARRPHELPRPRSGKELPKQPQERRCPRRKASLCHCSTCSRSCADPSWVLLAALRCTHRSTAKVRAVIDLDQQINSQAV